eukprot:6237765-Alexandrium_andersonii.AAC.1
MMAHPCANAPVTKDYEHPAPHEHAPTQSPCRSKHLAHRGSTEASQEAAQATPVVGHPDAVTRHAP